MTKFDLNKVYNLEDMLQGNVRYPRYERIK